MRKSRTKASIRNSMTSVIIQMLTVLIGFIQRTIFIKFLGVEYLGVSGLFSNILSILSLAELGFGSAIVYSMYKPMANNDEEMLGLLMSLYRKIYNVIGVAVLVIGLLLTPFLRFFIKDIPDIEHLYLIYMMNVVNTGLSYFFVYKSSIITVAQEEYIITLNRFVFCVMQNIVQIAILYIFKSYIIYLFAAIASTFLTNVSISAIANKKYPFIKRHTQGKLPGTEINKIKKNVYAMFAHRLGQVLVNATDNLLISKLVSIVAVGLYSNYLLIIRAVNVLIGKIFSSITASVGNLGATENKENSYAVFKNILFINNICAGFCSVALYMLLNTFIELWLGRDFLFGPLDVGLIVFVFYLGFIRKTTLTFRDSFGLFWYDRYKPFVESAVNLGVSIILGRLYGITGIFIGTIASNIGVAIWVEGYVLYKYGFKIGISEYLKLLIKYFAVTLIGAAPCVISSIFLNSGTVVDMIIRALICISSMMTVYYLFFRRTDEYKFCYNLIFSTVMKQGIRSLRKNNSDG